jgi:AcrR family transcriptional regulator
MEASNETYADRLARTMSGSNGETKRERTRASLKLAALELLRASGLSKLTVTGVTRKAKVADGTFYTHFERLDDLVAEVIREFLISDVRPAVPWLSDEEPFEALRNAFLPMVRHYRANLMIYRSIQQLRGEDERIRTIWMEMNSNWAQQFARMIPRNNEGALGLDERFAVILGHAATSLFDEFVVRVYLDKATALAELAEDDELIAEALAIFRYRLLLASDPPMDKLARLRPAFSNVRALRRAASRGSGAKVKSAPKRK